MKRILLGVNFKKGLEDILEDAYLLAYEFDAELIPVHVVEELSVFSKKNERKLLHDRLEQHLQKVREELFLRNIKVADSVVLEGKVCECLLSASQMLNCDLILIGSGSNDAPPYSLGRSAKKLLRQAKVPVWISNPKSPLESFNEIVCAIDFSYRSKKTLESAINVAQALNAKLKITYVCEETSLYLGFSESLHLNDSDDLLSSLPDRNKAQIDEEVARLNKAGLKDMEEFIADLDFHDLQVEKEVLYGYAHQEILHTMAKSSAGLLIMGSHGRGGFIERILGGTVEKVLDRLNCTILVIT